MNRVFQKIVNKDLYETRDTIVVNEKKEIATTINVKNMCFQFAPFNREGRGLYASSQAVADSGNSNGGLVYPITFGSAPLASSLTHHSQNGVYGPIYL